MFVCYPCCFCHGLGNGKKIYNANYGFCDGYYVIAMLYKGFPGYVLKITLPVQKFQLEQKVYREKL